MSRTNTEETWNPIVGCSVVSPGCTNCYAMRTAARLANIPVTPQYHGTVQPSRKGPVWTGKVALAEKALPAPLKRKKPTMYSVNSMGDLFHEDVPEEWIDRVFSVMARCPQHTFQVLTKRAERMREYCDELYHSPPPSWTCERLDCFDVHWPLPNVWLGVSAEDQTRADERIPHLLNTTAAVRFVSCEPLLGQINLTMLKFNGVDESGYLNTLTGEKMLSGFGSVSSETARVPALDWVITGGESGPNARPMHPDWARDLRDQCQAGGVPFFFKQWGEWITPGHGVDPAKNQPMKWMREDGVINGEPLSATLPGKPEVGEKRTIAGEALDKAAMLERRRESGKYMRQITEQQRAEIARCQNKLLRGKGNLAYGPEV